MPNRSSVIPRLLAGENPVDILRAPQPRIAPRRLGFCSIQDAPARTCSQRPVELAIDPQRMGWITYFRIWAAIMYFCRHRAGTPAGCVRYEIDVNVKGLSIAPRHTGIRSHSDSSWRYSRHSESEEGPVRYSRRCRDAPAMGVDDRPADRESHAHALRLRCDE
jgi:hypothetical protein